VPNIHHRIQVAAGANVVSDLVATGSGFERWWAEDVTTETDGRVSLGFFNRATIYRLRLVKRSGDLVLWRCESGDEWHDTELRFALLAEGEAVVLDFLHAKWRSETPYFTSCNTTWGELMFRIKAEAEGKPRGPLFRRSATAY
jgi:hypothetical protein